MSGESTNPENAPGSLSSPEAVNTGTSGSIANVPPLTPHSHSDSLSTSTDHNEQKNLGLASGSVNSGADNSVSWHSLLKNCRKTGLFSDCQLIVLGDSNSGKSTFINKFSDRSNPLPYKNSNNNPNNDDKSNDHFLCDYTLVNVKNKFNLDKDEILGHLHVSQYDDPTHSSLIQLSLARSLKNLEKNFTKNDSSTNNNNLHNSSNTNPNNTPNPNPSLSNPSKAGTMSSKLIINSSSSSSSGVQSFFFPHIFVIIIDFSNPATILSQAKSWLKVIEEESSTFNSKLKALGLPIDKFMYQVSVDLQSFHLSQTNSSVPIINNSNNPSNSNNSISNPNSLSLSEINVKIPEKNFGVPIVLVGSKLDLFIRKISSEGDDLREEKFDVVTRRLRLLALEYGASLFYTSSAGRGTGINVDVVQSYIYHRLFKFPFKFTPKVMLALNSNESNTSATTTNNSKVNNASLDNNNYGANSLVDFGICVPSGYDSWDLIEAAYSKHDSGNSDSKKIQQRWSDDLVNLQDFFQASTSRKTVASTQNVGNTQGSSSQSQSQQNQATTAIRAADSVIFLKNMKYQLEHGQTNNSSQIAGGAVGSAGSVGGGSGSIIANGVGAGSIVNKLQPNIATLKLSSTSNETREPSATASLGPNQSSNPQNSSNNLNSLPQNNNSTSNASAVAAAAKAKVAQADNDVAVKQFFRSLLKGSGGAGPSSLGAKSTPSPSPSPLPASTPAPTAPAPAPTPAQSKPAPTTSTPTAGATTLKNN